MEKFQQIKAVIESPEMEAKFASHNTFKLNFKNEVQFLLAHLVKMKAIDKVDVVNLENVLVDTAMAGITLDPTLNYSYVALRNINGKLTAVYDIGYQGMITKLKLLSDIEDLYAHVVFENDIFNGQQGLNPNLEHQPYYFLKMRRAERGEPTGAYAVIVFKDGYRKFDFLPVERIEEIRNLSSDYRTDKKNGTQNSAWLNEHWEEMWKKTMIKHAYKTIPKNHVGPDLEAALKINEAFEHDNQKQGMEITTAAPLVDVIEETKADEKVIAAVQSIQDAANAAISKGKIQKDTEEEKANPDPDLLFTYIPRTELHQMYKEKDGKKELDKYAIRLGLFESIVAKNPGKRTSKKMVLNAILKHYDEKNINPSKKEPAVTTQAKDQFDGDSKNTDVVTEPRLPVDPPVIDYPKKEDDAAIMTIADQLRGRIRETGIKSFIKATLKILDHLACPSQDPEKLRSTTGCSVLYSFIQQYGVEQELEKLFKTDPYDFIAKATNDELRAALQ